jgi:3-oxoacyl-[acyl-carrier protein] reductase
MSRSVLVTGASRGIGRAIVTAFEELGDRVFAHSTAQADLSDPVATRAMVERAIDELGQIDVLVNNSAVSVANPPVTSTYEQWVAAWQETFAVNMFGAANVSHCVVKHMVSRGEGGRIINVGSRGAFRGEPANPAYGASKAALHSFGQSLAVAVAPYGIGVASVAPGYILTERQADRLAGPDGETIRAQSPFARVGTPQEVAAAVVYLASPQGIWASGSVLDLNGASYLH